MPPYITHRPEQDVAREVVAHAPGRRADLAAGLAVALIAALLLGAQLTLVLTTCFSAVGRVSRWRPLWLAIPAVVGIAWVLVIGLGQAADGYLAVAGKLISGFTGGGSLPVGLERVPRVFASWPQWLPRQFPIALVGSAALAFALGRTRATQPYRPGALVFLRGRYLTGMLRRGEVATADGCCLGVVAGRGTGAVVAWSEAAEGLLCTGARQALVTATGLELATAAIQHRKAVVVVDLAAQNQQGALLTAACVDIAAPLRQFGRQAAHYDPFGDASPARATSLVMAMIEWSGVPHAEQLFCANYLNAALSLIASGRPRRPDAMLAELVSLLEPGALQAGLAQLSERPATSPPARITEQAGRVEGGYQARLAARLAELDASALGRFLRPADDAISIGRALDHREVAYFPLGERLGERVIERVGPAEMLARLVVADLVDNLARRSDAGGTADCLVWINGCEAIDGRQLRALLELGQRTGTAVVLGTTAGSAVDSLASEVNVVSVRGHLPPETQNLAELASVAGRPEELVISVRRPARTVRCVAVR